MSSAPKSKLKRIGLLLSGEGLQSGLHFALNLAFMHRMSAYDYGVFAIAMLIGGIGLSYIRSMTGLPASAYIGRSRTGAARHFIENAFTWFAIAVAVTVGLIGYLTLLLMSPSVALAGGVFAVLWCARTHARTVYFASERQREATIGDFAFAGTAALLAAGVLWRGVDLLLNAMLLLAAANFVGLAAMRLSSGVQFLVRPRKRFASVYARLLPQLGWSILGVTTVNIQSQGISFLIVAIAGPAAFAPLAAMIVFFAPLRIVTTALVNFMQPEVSRLLAKHEIGELRRRMLTWTAYLAVVGVVYAIGMAIVLPFVAARTLMDGPVLLVGACAWAISGMALFYVSPRVLLEVLLRFRAVAIMTIIAAIVGFGLTSLLLYHAPLHWALLGSVASELTVAAISWLVAFRALREAAQKPAG